MSVLLLSGTGLSIEDVQNVIDRKRLVCLSSGALERVKASHEWIADAVAANRVIYGVTTGFGSMSNQVIDAKDCRTLQENLIRSHAIGTGPPAPPEIVRCMLLLRLNCIAWGHSGVSLQTVNTLTEALNKNVLPEVPEQGSVGASGDLCPLSHLMLGLMGEGRIRDPSTGTFMPAQTVLDAYDIPRLCLGPKEGLALNNGTQFITSYLFQAYSIARNCFQSSLMGTALTLEMLHGTSVAYDERISRVRPHEGQIQVASRLREILSPLSEIAQTRVTNVQEAYSLRCAPQILGPVHDLLAQVEKILMVEMNSVNDNPLIFLNDVISGGNFHGQYPAVAADLISLGMSIVANASERRLERLVNGNINICRGDTKKHLPSFLVDNPGLNSGLMILQYQAAALAAENRHLAAPGCVHSIPTCENQEDVVSMGGWSARKALQSARNAARVVAAEIYAGSLASFYTPESTTDTLEALIKDMDPQRLHHDRYYKPEYDEVVEKVEKNLFMGITK